MSNPLQIGFRGQNDKYNPAMTTGAVMASAAVVQQERMSRYAKNWRAYLGHDVNQPADKDLASGGNRTGETEGRINYNKICVDAMVAFAFGNPWTLTPEYKAVPGLKVGEDIPAEVKKEREKIGEMINFIDDVINRDNPGDSQRIKKAQFCAVTGDAFLTIQPVLPDSLELLAVGLQKPEESKKEWKIRVVILDPAQCIAAYGTDGETLISLEINYPVAINNPADPAVPHQGMFRQVITATKIYERLVDHQGSLVSERNVDNPIGVVYGVHIRNMPGPTMYGQDDVSSIRGANVELNDKMSDVSDIIDYHSAPTTVIFGARAANLEKGANKVWSGLPVTARVENVALASDLPAANVFMDSLRKMIKETSGVNDAAIGADLAISNTSGVALHTRFYSMMSKALLKWSSWTPAIKSMALIVLRWGKYLNQIEFDDGMLLKFNRVICVSFTSNLPKDELLEIQKNHEGVKNGLLARTKALGNLGSKDPDADLAQINREIKDNPDLTSFVLGQPLVLPGQNGVDGDGKFATVGSTGRNLSGLRSSAET